MLTEYKTNSLSDVIERRRMCRAYADHPLEEFKLQHLLRLSSMAPRAGNTKIDPFIILRRSEDRSMFWRAAWPTRVTSIQSPMFAAPIIIIVVAELEPYIDRYERDDKKDSPIDRWPSDFSVVDASFAVHSLLLGATELGLGSWFFGVDAERVRETFAISQYATIVGAVALGHKL